MRRIRIIPSPKMLTQDEVRHIAKLAKIKLSEDEVTKFSTELSGILEFFATLQEIDTENTEETSQVTGLSSIVRPDIINSSDIEDELLECSPHPCNNHSIQIPRIM